MAQFLEFQAFRTPSNMVQEHTPSDPTPGQDPIQGSRENAFSPPTPAETSEVGGGSWLLEPSEMQADTPVVIGECGSESESVAGDGSAASRNLDHSHLEVSYVEEAPKFTPRAAIVPIAVGAVLAFAGSAVVSLRNLSPSTDSGRFPKPIVLTEDLNPEVELVGPVFNTQRNQSQPSQRRSIDRNGDVAPAKASSVPTERKPVAARKQAPQPKQEQLSQTDKHISATEESPVMRALALSELPTKGRDTKQGKRKRVQTKRAKNKRAQSKQQVGLPIELQSTESTPVAVAQVGTQPPLRPASWDEIPAQSMPSTASPVARVGSTEELLQDSAQVALGEMSEDTTEVASEETVEDSGVASISVKDPFPMAVVIEPAPWFGESIELTLEPLWPGFEAGDESTDDLTSSGEPMLIEDIFKTAQEPETDVFAEMDQESTPEAPISLPNTELLALDRWPGRYQEHGTPESLPAEEENLVAQQELSAPEVALEATPEAAPLKFSVVQEEFWLGPDGTEWSPRIEPDSTLVAVAEESETKTPAELMDEATKEGLSPEVAALLALSEDDLERQRQENGLEVGPQLEQPGATAANPDEGEELATVVQATPEPEFESDESLVAAAEPEVQPEPSNGVSEPAEERAPRDLLGAYSDWMRLANLAPVDTPVLAMVNGVPGSAYAPYSLSQEQGDLQPTELKTEGKGVEVALSSAPHAGGVLRRASSDHRWEGVEIPEQAIGAERKLLTPRVGPVRVDLVDGQSLEGRLHSVGFKQLWLETSLGQITLESRRIAQIHKLDPGQGMPTLHKAKDYSKFPLVRVTVKGGTLVGYELARDGNTITMVTDKGLRITLTDVEITSARQYRAVDLRRVEDYEAEKAVAAE